MTARILRTQILAPAMDAKALNETQAHLIANRSPQVDSLVEVVQALTGTCTSEQRDLLQRMLEIVRDLAAANYAEGELEREIAGTVEQLATDLRATLPCRQWTVKRAADALRAPLADLTNPIIHGRRRVRAAALVDAVIDTCPRALLMGASLRHELRKGKAFALHARITDRDRNIA